LFNKKGRGKIKNSRPFFVKNRIKQMEVSIIVPVYNVEKYIADCFCSIANQTYKNIEAIFVDDCSTDNSYKILSRLKERQKDGEIQYKIIRREKNGGVNISRNIGIAEARGKYLFFIDSDDVIAPNCIERLLNFAEKYPNAEIIQGNHSSFNEDIFNKFFHSDMTKENWNIVYENISFNYKQKDAQEIITGSEIIKLWLYNLQFYESIALLGVWATLYKTDFLKEKNIYFSDDLPTVEDVYFRYLCFKNATQIVIDHYPIYFYRSRNDSLSSAQDQQYRRKECWAICLEKMLLDADKEQEYSQLLLRFCFAWAKFWAQDLKTEKEKSLISKYLNILKKIG
jgi:glycosyltransferase EpsH